MKKTTFTRKKKTVRIAGDPAQDSVDKTEKKEVQNERLSGTRISVLTGQANVSSGHSFIDSAWGGGLGLGQIALVQEDVNSTYYRVLLSLSIAQALCLPEPQECLLISQSSFLPLPKALNFKESTFPQESDSKQEKMKIAWRYDDNLKEKHDPSGTRRAPFNNMFDLHKPMELTEHRKESLICLPLAQIRAEFPSNLDSQVPSSKEFFSNLLSTIEQNVKRCKEEKKVLRIILHSLGSPFWLDYRNNNIEKELLRFVHQLKGIIRDSTAVCMISFPAHLFSASVLGKLQRTCDIACSFESFKGQTDQEVDEAFKEYQGFFKVHKLPRINSLTRHLPDTPSYVFSRKRHKLLVEVFALPPEMSRTTESSQSQAATKMLCQPGPPKASVIDF